MTDFIGFAIEIRVVFAATAWVLSASLANLLAMAWDKRRAVSRGRRIRESTLLWLAWLGGAPGMGLAMVLVRHKTRHGRFQATAAIAGTFWGAWPVAAMWFLIAPAAGR